MPLFTAIAVGIGAAIGAGAFFVSATSFVLQTAAGIGLNLLAKKIAGKKQPQQQQSTGPGFSVQGRLNSGGDVPRSFMVGWGSTAGSLVYANTWGADGNTPNAYFVQVIALSDLPVDSLEGVWVNGELCTIGGSAHADFGNPITQYNSGGKDHLWVKFYDGTQTTADAYLVSKFGTDPSRPYPSTRVGTGVAYAVCTALVNDELFTGFPAFKFELNGVKFYDPSKDTSVGGSGDQRWDTPATWGGDGDHLPAVQIYNVMRGITYGGEWFYGLQGMTAARLPVSNWITQIEKCRAVVEGPAGDEARYRSGGEIVIANQIGDTVEELLTACQGKVSEIGGFYKIHLGEPDSPVFSFTDDDIISTEEQSFTPFFGLADTINGITAKYPSSDEAWNMKPAPPVYRTDLEILAGNRRLLADVDLNYVPYTRQVQDLMQTALAEAQRARRHTFTLPPEFWIYEPGDIGEWTSERNGYETKQFRLDGVLDKANLDVMFDLTEIEPDDYDFDFGNDYDAPTVGPVTVVRPPAQAIVDFAVSGVALTDDDGVSRHAAILLSWEGNVDDVAGVEYQVRKASSGAAVTNGTTPDFAAGSVAISQGIIPLTQYEARGRYIPNSPRETEWSAWLSVTTPDARLTIEDFDAATEDYVFNLLDPERNGTNFALQRVAWHAAQQDLANADDRRETRRILNEQIGDVIIQITETAEIAQEIDGKLSAVYSLTINNDGYISGMVSYNNGQHADTIFITDTFQVAAPDISGGLPVPVFVVGNVDGEAKVGIRGDMFIDGSITVTKLDVAELSAITADIGEATAGIIRSPDNKMIIDLNNGRIEVWD